MQTLNITTILLSIFSSSLVSLLISTILLDPLKEKKKYIFTQKQQIYHSLIVFAQIVLYPSAAKFSLHVTYYDITQLSDKKNVSNALNDLKMSIPRLKLITKNSKVVHSVQQFIDEPNESTFDALVHILQKDLYK